MTKPSKDRRSLSREGADLDPDISRFIQITGEAYRAHPPFDTLTPARRRAVAEEVRKPWTQGGPVMARTRERSVPSPHGDVRVRIHEPQTEGVRPALIYVHGGGWVLFSLDTHDRVMREYAARADVTVIGVDYAHSPEARFPVALEQILAVVRWAHAEGTALGIDPQRLALGGDSVGGNMSLAAAMVLRDKGEGDTLKALHLSYGAFDDRVSAEAADRFGGPEYMLTAEEMDGFWAAYLNDGAERADPRAVPARGDLHDLPPAFLTIPDCDVLTEQSLALAVRMKDAGLKVRDVVYPGASHSFLEAVSVSPLADRALQDGADWLKATLRNA